MVLVYFCSVKVIHYVTCTMYVNQFVWLEIEIELYLCLTYELHRWNDISNIFVAFGKDMNHFCCIWLNKPGVCNTCKRIWLNCFTRIWWISVM